MPTVIRGSECDQLHTGLLRNLQAHMKETSWDKQDSLIAEITEIIEELERSLCYKAFLYGYRLNNRNSSGGR